MTCQCKDDLDALSSELDRVEQYVSELGMDMVTSAVSPEEFAESERLTLQEFEWFLGAYETLGRNLDELFRRVEALEAARAA